MIAALVLSVMALLPAAWRSGLTEQSYDVIARFGTAMKPPAQMPVRIVVVDIDAATLALHGSWPWPRHHLAKLVTQIASAQPAAFAMDMLLADADQRSASALARQLAQETGRQDIQSLAAHCLTQTMRWPAIWRGCHLCWALCLILKSQAASHPSRF